MKWLCPMAVFGALLISGCTSQPQGLAEADLAGIQMLLETVQRTVSAEDNAAWANTFTPDGRFLNASMPPLRGRAAIQQWGESGPRVTSLVFSDVEIEGADDTAWATGVQTLMVDGSPAPDRGKWLMVMEHQPNGSWLTAAASVSSDSPPAGQ